MKFLVIRFSSLGDCILLCPLLAHLEQSGAEEVVVLTKRAYAEIFANATGVDRVVALDKSAGAGALWRLAGEFRDRGYTILDAHASWRSRMVGWRTGRVDARIAKHTRERLDLIVFKRAVALPTMLERYARLCEPAGLAVPQLAPGGIRIPNEFSHVAERAMSGPFIAVAPGSRWPAKRWNGFERLCEVLARESSLLLVGDSADREFTAPIAKALGDRALDIAGHTPLMQTAAHIARCRAFVGNDSGLMHLAEAVGVPVVALFGPTVQAFGYYPSLAQSRTLERRIACRPCSRNGSTPCPRRTGECLTAISADTVANTIATLFDASAPRRVILD
jgi:heptosyltransferase-2